MRWQISAGISPKSVCMSMKLAVLVKYVGDANCVVDVDIYKFGDASCIVVALSLSTEFRNSHNIPVILYMFLYQIKIIY